MNNTQQINIQNQPEQVPTGTVQHSFFKIKPTSSEIYHLWSTYIAYSMACAMQKHMVAKSQDPDFKNVLQTALDSSTHHIQQMEEIFKAIDHPIPDAFGEKDVDINAPPLFEEIYCVKYTRLLSKSILINHSRAYGDSSRTDFIDLFGGFIDDTKKIIRLADDVLLAKALFHKSPTIIKPDKVDYIHNKKYYGSFWGSDRPLNAMEISNIYNLMDFKTAMKTLKVGFAQVIKTEKLKKHLNRGIKMADKQLKVLGSILKKERLPEPTSMDFWVTNSKESPYSERLMMFHVTITLAYIVSYYGLGLTNSLRKDVILSFSRLMLEVMEYIKDGTDLLIENGWMERVPGTVDRQELLH
ncbi:MAG TPA: DUF3231 family protein [Peptococcaceae bacterium]|nr:DUF3231 family protein [Peptococcaceae bacterium]